MTKHATVHAMKRRPDVAPIQAALETALETLAERHQFGALCARFAPSRETAEGAHRIRIEVNTKAATRCATVRQTSESGRFVVTLPVPRRILRSGPVQPFTTGEGQFLFLAAVAVAECGVRQAASPEQGRRDFGVDATPMGFAMGAARERLLPGVRQGLKFASVPEDFAALCDEIGASIPRVEEEGETPEEKEAETKPRRVRVEVGGVSLSVPERTTGQGDFPVLMTPDGDIAVPVGDGEAQDFMWARIASTKFTPEVRERNADTLATAEGGARRIRERIDALRAELERLEETATA